MRRKRLNERGDNGMTASASKSPRRRRKAFAMAAMLASLGIYLGVMVFAGGAPWLIWVVLFAALLIAVFASLWVASLDEAALQAHYVAWYWGGSAGVVLSMLIYVLAMLQPGAFQQAVAMFGPAADAQLGFGAGVLLGLVPAVLGYKIWWVVLWLRRG